MPNHSNSRRDPNFSELLKRLGELHSGTKAQQEKNKILAVVAPIVSRTKLWENGWKFSKNTFSRVRQNRHLSPRPPPSHALKETSKKKIQVFFEDNCLPSGGKKFKIGGEEVQALFYEDTITALYKKFCGENPGIKISYSSFCKLRPPQCVKTQLWTDVCPHCKYLQALKRKGHLSGAELRREKDLTLHKEEAGLQRDLFKQNLKALSKNQKEAIILIDFKENHRCWRSREQDADSFRNNLIATVFNAAVFVAAADGSIQLHNWTFVSDNLSHDSFFVKEALKQMLQTNDFKQLGLKQLTFWMEVLTSVYMNSMDF